MALLRIVSPDGSTRQVRLVKQVISVGRAPDNDVVLVDPHAPDDALHLERRGAGYTAIAHTEPVEINGRAREEHVLGAGDRLRVGRSELHFELELSPQPVAPGRADERAV